MDAPEIESNDGLVVEPHVLLEHDGEKLVTLVKATYEEQGGELVLAARQRPIRHADEAWGDPHTTPPKYPCDACGEKPGTDVIVVAKGHAPDGKPVPSFDVAVSVGPLQKSLRIHGLRVWLDGGSGISAPRPLVAEEIRYDRAWGGLDTSDPSETLEEPRNPVGRGITRNRAALTHQPAPTIEDPAHPITSAARGEPAGFGPLGFQWMPRRRHHGTYDEAWLRDQCPLLPADRDPRANLCASPGLTATPPLSGDEPMGLLNLTPGGGALQLRLPGARPAIVHTLRGQRVVHIPHLDTVIIDTLDVAAKSRVTVELVWRTVVRPPRRLRDLRIAVEARA
jgi:hypothetical protein